MHNLFQKCLDWFPQSAPRLQKKILQALDDGNQKQAYFLLDRYLHQSIHEPEDTLFLLAAIDRFYDEYLDSEEARFLTISVLQFIMKFDVRHVTDIIRLAFFRIHVFSYHIMCEFFLRKQDSKNFNHFYAEYQDCLKHYHALLPREHIIFDVYFKLLYLQHLDTRREADNLTDEEYQWEAMFLNGLGEAIESLYTANQLKPLTFIEEFGSVENMDFVVYMWLCHGRDGVIRQDVTAPRAFSVADTLAQKVQFIAEKEGVELNGESHWTYLAVQYYKNGVLPDTEVLRHAWHAMADEERECAKLTLTNQPIQNDALLEWINIKN